MLSMTFLILAYAKYCRINQNNFLGSNPGHHQNVHGLIRSGSRFSGIDEELINSLPFFRSYGSQEILLLKKLRYLQNPSDLTEDPNLEIFVEREQDHQGSLWFNPRSSIQINNDKDRKEELLIIAGRNADDNRKLLHKFKHKIIISDVLIKNRWSDVNSSDFLSLNTEMLRVMSSNRFSPLKSSSARFHNGLSRNENFENIEDIERKRLFESKFTTVDRSNSVSSSSLNSSKMINPASKRSMSEITIFSRFRQLSVRNKTRESTSPGNGATDERIRKLWLPIARRTIQWFAGQERNIQQLEYQRQSSNV
ncbi:hypothetical protein Peur_067945 [Populus x canadensis]